MEVVAKGGDPKAIIRDPKVNQCVQLPIAAREELVEGLSMEQIKTLKPGQALVAVLPLEDTAVSTSGDYERFFEADGVRHHHIIDPSTGRSPKAIHSVTILAADGLTAEALSKTLFVLGLERGMALIESQPGVDAVVVDAHGQLHYSTGLQAPQGA